MLLEIFIIQKGTSFLLVRRAFTKKEIQMEGALFSGMISAISLFTTELKMGEIQFFETKENRIMIHPYEDIIVVGIGEEKEHDTCARCDIHRWKKYRNADHDDAGKHKGSPGCSCFPRNGCEEAREHPVTAHCIRGPCG